LGQSRREIDPLTTAGELHDLLAEDGPDLLEKVLADHAANQLSPLTQEESEVTLAPKLRKSDGWIDFCDTAESARRRVHALTPWPGVSVAFRDQPLKILRVQPTSADREQDPGVIINASEGTVMCANHTALKLLEVQPAGGKAMNWSAFANGRRVESGERLIGGAPPC
ncbi:MAG: methionyl-tRNA formyltransferase, partial [Planctomycetota bacterium]|nr:methionyl-tRNA formyltransferase [Planctomycetota bacterium]